MKFEQYSISTEIKRSLAELGFKRPTDIQFRAIPNILNGDDVLAIAQTGTGKTAAFAIPVLHTLQYRSNHNTKGQVSCLVMVPTRELAIQIATVFEQIAKYTDLTILGLFGGVEQEPQIKKLQKGIDVLIATPGRMFDLINQEHLDLSRVSILVLDEADFMLDLGFIKDIRDVLKHLPRKHQTLFFSATIDKDIKELAYSIVNNPIRIQVSPKDPVSKNVSHAVAYVEMDDKRYFLERLVKEFPDNKILVFVRTKVRAERVYAAMQRVGIETLTMHGGKDQDNRLEVMEEFKNGAIKVLVTTDVNARGIDIPDVDYVVNYDLPDVPENYVHRVGRTGRGVKKGEAVSFCSTEEKPILEEIVQYLGKDIREMKIDKTDYRETISFSEEAPNDNWRLLLEENEKAMGSIRKKEKKKIMKPADILRYRLASQQICGTAFKKPEEIVHHMVAMQAQEYAMAKWAIGLRLHGVYDGDVEEAFNEGRILRTHLMRPTWHFVAPQDIRWLQALTAHRVQAFNAYMYRKCELDNKLFKRSINAITKALEGNNFLTRTALQAELAKAKIQAEGVRLACIIMYAELEAVLCSGPRQGKQFTYALLEERVPAVKAISREDALALLVLRYFTTRGPATISDFVWWSGLTVKDAKEGLGMTGDKLSIHNEGEGIYYYPPDAIPAKTLSGATFLFPDYDEYGISYKDRSALSSGKNNKDKSTDYSHWLVIDGRIDGTWRRINNNKSLGIDTTFFSALGKAKQQAVKKTVQRYLQFAGQNNQA